MDTSPAPPPAPVLHLIVYGCASEQEGVNEVIKSHCERYLGAEHQADEDVKQTHVHYAIVEPTVKDNRWGEMLNKLGYTGRKDFVKLWKIPDGEYKGQHYNERKLDIYIIKGRVDTVKYNKGYSEEYIEECAEVWRKPQRRFTKPSVDPSQDRTSDSLDASSPGESPQNDSKAQRKPLEEWIRIKDDFTKVIMESNKCKFTVTGLRKWVNVWSYKNSGQGLVAPKCMLQRYTTSLYFFQFEISSGSLAEAAEHLEEEKCF